MGVKLFKSNKTLLWEGKLEEVFKGIERRIVLTEEKTLCGCVISSFTLHTY